jgi:hypothetical protein
VRPFLKSKQPWSIKEKPVNVLLVLVTPGNALAFIDVSAIAPGV